MILSCCFNQMDSACWLTTVKTVSVGIICMEQFAWSKEGVTSWGPRGLCLTKVNQFFSHWPSKCEMSHFKGSVLANASRLRSQPASSLHLHFFDICGVSLAVICNRRQAVYISFFCMWDIKSVVMANGSDWGYRASNVSLLLCNEESVNKLIKTISHISFWTRNVIVWLTDAKKVGLGHSVPFMANKNLYFGHFADCNVSKPWAESRIKLSLNCQESHKRKQKRKNESENHLLTLVDGKIQNTALGWSSEKVLLY